MTPKALPAPAGHGTCAQAVALLRQTGHCGCLTARGLFVLQALAGVVEQCGADIVSREQHGQQRVRKLGQGVGQAGGAQ